MYDTMSAAPNPSCLFLVANEHAGYFTAREATDCGYSRQLMAHFVKNGRFLRVRRGLYRLRDYPTSRHEEEMIAWLSLGPDSALLSHTSALSILDLSDIVPDQVHVSVPRTRRGLHPPPGVILHTLTQSVPPDETMMWEGIHVTGPARSIVDAAATGSDPEQIVVAARQALQRGMLTPARLRRAALGQKSHVLALIEQALSET